ncbi:aldo/keto reductase [Domibacillus robiginosus]|uniref:aldo/keto reductase n=1 Tax=Domibacillus robiginosus TaxID=1071054 RepID=UPI00067DA79E|nr:aldo/keto reductase [Domibacillus robiginosus]
MNIQSTFTLNHGEKSMPWVGLGVFQVENGETVAASVEEAIVQGYRHIDTAAVYENEEGVGEGIRRGMERAGITREQLFITSKLWNADQGYQRTLEAYQKSVARLGLDQLDLYLIHWPVEGLFPESWRALEQLFKEGKVGSIGVSNFQIHHIETLLQTAEITPAINQVERHPRLVQEDLKQYLVQKNIQPVAWAPLMQGGIFSEPVLMEIAESLGKTVAQIVLKWHLQTGWAVIPKSIKKHRIHENADLYDFELNNEQVKAIHKMDQHHRVGPDPDHFDF